MNMKRSMVAVVGIVVALACVAGCSSDKTVSASDAEAKLIQTQKGKVGGLKLGKASCPDDVKVKEGATFTCTLAIGDVEAPYKVTL